jgi:hypothetical protein
MKRQKNIQINQFQLKRLLNAEEQKGYALLLREGVFCPQCGNSCAKGVEVTEIHLNDMNDILIRGICKVCKGRVARIMEFGENPGFYVKANEFRESI